jgi:lactonase
MVLEGPYFDRSGNLLFSEASGGRVLRLRPAKRISTVFNRNNLAPGGLVVHKDGRIFIAAVGLRMDFSLHVPPT